MIKNSIQRNSPSKRGFTLLESLVAVSILVTVIIGITTAVQTGMSSYIYSKNQILAFYLAQEGIEQIRNRRDENGLRDRDWLHGIARVNGDPCFFGEACTIDTVANDLRRCPSGPGSCPSLRQHEVFGYIGYNSSWPAMNFTREVTLTEIVPDEEILVTSVVRWNKGITNVEFVAQELLLNWQ